MTRSATATAWALRRRRQRRLLLLLRLIGFVGPELLHEFTGDRVLIDNLLLDRLGYEVVHIPLGEWSLLKNEHVKQRYLQRKISAHATKPRLGAPLYS